MGASFSSMIPPSSFSRNRAVLGTAFLGLLGGLWVWRRALPAPPAPKHCPKLEIGNPGRIQETYSLEESEARPLGTGDFGCVVQAQKKSTGELVAVKKLRKVENLEERVASEIDIMKSLAHDNIIVLLETFEDPETYFLVMELASGLELFDRVIELGTFTEKAAVHCMRQVLGAIHYCHERNICVGCPKPEDIMCMTRDSIDQVKLKLIDFGSSARLEPGAYLSAKIGTSLYVAPQILAGRYDCKCDLWSCGVITYVILCGYPPFSGETDEEVTTKVRLGNYMFKAADWKDASDEAKDLIRHLLKLNPTDRFSADQAVKWVEQKWAPAV
eukprot:TRINITY_DN4569_c0_g2_i1.p1 TRINITY_DN4569_c0_g2~~TRINITY_DN4569_c0_g2_i1.p1  ORF type:complete len:329 (-),score=44.94 TRINITY_DN4569_c0_g2_i1:131-1117(-)